MQVRFGNWFIKFVYTIWFLHWTEQKYGIYNGNGDCSTSLRPVEVRLNYL